MRKKLIYLCIFFAGCNFLDAQNYFSMESKTVQQAVDFSIEILANSDFQIGAFQFDIFFQDSSVEITTEPAVSILDSFTVNYSQIDGGGLRIVAYRTVNEQISFDETPILRLNFKSLSNPTDITPSVDNFIVSDLYGNQIDMDFQVGTISVLGPKLYLDRNQIDIGDRILNETLNYSFNIYNNGNQDLNVERIFFPVGITNTDIFPLTISPNSYKNISISIDTSIERVIQGNITLVTNDKDDERASQYIYVNANIYSRNYLYLNNINAIKGEVSSIDLFFENQKECVGLQFDLNFPDGIVIDTESIELTSRLSKHSSSVSNIGNNTYRFLIYSTSNNLIESYAIESNNDISKLLSFSITPNGTDNNYQIEMTGAVALDKNQKDILSSFKGSQINVITPNLELSTNNINLGEFNSGSEIGFEIGLSNNSPLTLEIDSLKFDKNKITIKEATIPFSIAPGGFKSLEGKYKSNSIGVFENSIIIYHNGKKTSDEIRLTGTVKAQNYLYVNDLELLIDTVDTLRINLLNDSAIRGIQFDIDVNQNVNIAYDQLQPTQSLNNFKISTSKLIDGKQRFLIYNTQNEIIPAGNTTIVSVPVNGINFTDEVAYDVIFSEAYLTDINNAFVQTNPSSNGQIKIVTNTSPIVTSQHITTTEDQSVTFEIIASDKDGDILTYNVPLSTSRGGRLERHGGEITYMPKKNFFGLDEFSYEVTDGKNVIVDIITFEVSAINDPPTLSDYFLSAKQDQKGEISLSALDVDSLDDQISFEISIDPDFGVSDIVNNTLTYMPNRGFYGNDELSIRSFDGSDYSDEVKVTINVSKLRNATPTGSNLEFTTNQNEKLTIKLVGNDPEEDEITFDYSSPQNGTISTTDYSNTIEYTPNTDFFGTDSFTYTVSDNESSSSSYEISILVYEHINLPPVISTNNALTSINTSVDLHLRGNDPEEVDLIFSIYNQPNNGAASLSETNKLTYTPNNNYTGSDIVEILASDGIMSSEPTAISITVVEKKNTLPVGISNSYTLYNNSSQIIVLEGYDSDNDNISFKISEMPENGTLFNINDNKYEYFPFNDFSGDDEFTVIANDGNDDGLPFKINLSVLNKLNTRPTSFSYSCNRKMEGQTFKATLYGLDSDSSDNNKLTYNVVFVTNGILVNQANNEVEIEPNSNEQVLIEYDVSDGKETSDQATIIVN
jgi:hypothetical protein